MNAANERLCHCCGEPFSRCRETYRGDMTDAASERRAGYRAAEENQPLQPDASIDWQTGWYSYGAAIPLSEVLAPAAQEVGA